MFGWFWDVWGVFFFFFAVFLQHVVCRVSLFFWRGEV